MNMQRRTPGWMGIQRGHRARPLEWLAEKFIFLVSLSAILMVFLIFLFVAREALPIFLGKTDTALVQKMIPPGELDKLSPATLEHYLELTPEQFAAMDKETLKSLMEVKQEQLDEIPANFRNDPDAHINTTEWRYLLQPHQWSGYDKPEYIWQPVGQIQKYNIIPLFVGTLKVTLIGLFFAVPLAVGAAIYVSQLARPRVREIIKPTIELLSGIPSVVVGFFALLVMATVLQKIFGYQTRLNAFVAGIALGFAVIPVDFFHRRGCPDQRAAQLYAGGARARRVALADRVADCPARRAARRFRRNGSRFWPCNWRDDDRADGLFRQCDVVEHL